MITQEQIKTLYERYLELVLLEVQKFGVKPTEVRHLIGRLGEFHCALAVNRILAHEINQHGFDVISESGKKISVKTTAQKSGFVAISKSTLNQVDELMILQYKEGSIEKVYYGDIKTAADAATYYDHLKHYELSLSKAKRLQNKI